MRENVTFWMYSCLVTSMGIFLISVSGCQPTLPKKQMDQDVIEIIQGKWPKDTTEQIEYQLMGSVTKPDSKQIQGILGSEQVLSIHQALDFATSYNRQYQMQKEALYLQTLDLTLYRYHLGSELFSKATPSKKAAPPANVFAKASNTTELADAWAAILTGEMQGGGPVSVLKETLGNPMPKHIERDLQSEKLIQAERDIISRLRSFKRYQKTFVASILDDYYRVLQLQEIVTLSEEKRFDLEKDYERMQKLANAGYVLRFQLDQVLHDQILAQDDLMKAQRQYQDLLDEFKLKIGIPIHIELKLDTTELARLREGKLKKPEFTLAQGMQSALRLRLDLANQIDDVSDAARDILRRAYNPNARLEFMRETDTQWENNPQISTLQYLISRCNLDFPSDLPFDRLAERNKFRRDLVRLAKQQRDYEHKAETVKLEVEKSYRRLIQVNESYQLQQKALVLAESRLESTMKLLQNRRATMQDVLQAEDDLYNAKIDALDALIDHKDATLQLYRDIGILQVKPNGQWEIATIPN